MICELDYHGLDPADALTVAIDRWAWRLDARRAIERCAVTLGVEPGLLGIRQHAHIAITITAGEGEGAIELEVEAHGLYRERADLFTLIYDAFRNALRRLQRPALTA
jgi:hypothetical protein